MSAGGDEERPADDPAPDAQPGDELRVPGEPEGLGHDFAFRVARREPRRAILAFLTVGFVALLVGTLPVAIAVRALGAGPESAQRAFVAAAALAAVVGAWAALRWLRVQVSCSAPDCTGEPGPNDRACPGCGRPIVGTIAHPDDRLAAEDAVRDGAYWTDARDGR